jgi:DNA-binding beta-propeller fold protein YncE
MRSVLVAVALVLAVAVTASSAHTTAVDAARAPAQPQALVTDELQNRLLVVDLPSGRLAASVQLPPDPEDIAASSNSGVVVVVSSRAGKVTVLKNDTLRKVGTFDRFQQPHIVAISPDGRYAYITDDGRGTLTVIRLSDLKITATVFVGAGAHHLTFSPDERYVWVALGETAHEITILTTAARGAAGSSGVIADPGHPGLIGHLNPGFPAHDLAFSPNGQTVWVTSATGSDVIAFDARTRRPLFRVPVGPPPQHLVFSGRYAYITSGYGSTIERVDASTGHVIARTGAPYGSFELDAAEGYVVTSSLLRGTLAVYSPALRLLRVVKLAPATREVAISRG